MEGDSTILCIYFWYIFDVVLLIIYCNYTFIPLLDKYDSGLCRCHVELSEYNCVFYVAFNVGET
jgi:hypothetical protein